MRDTTLNPLLALIAANAVEQIQDGISLAFGITRRRVNLHPAFYADGLRFVINAFKFAALASLAGLVETLWRIRKGGFVVRLQLDWAAKSTTTATFDRVRGSGIR